MTDFGKVSLFLLTAILTANVFAQPPCTKSLLGHPCDYDTDCFTPGSICADGTCQCHSNYLEFPQQGIRQAFCQKAPETDGASCSKPNSYCKPPLICEGNTVCTCLRGKSVNGICTVISQIDQTCEDNYDCNAPFSHCETASKKCKCVAGTSFANGKCFAGRSCPDNTIPTGQSCRLLVPLESEMFDNFGNSGSFLDNCTPGSYCVTDGLSSTGFCCPVKCPLGGTVEAALTCEECPKATHYCTKAVGISYSTSVCCRKPCEEPNSIFALGQCWLRSYLGGQCHVTEQCDGGSNLLCANGICTCSPGYKPSVDKSTCVRDCGENIPVDNVCLPTKISLNANCHISDQCADPNAFCYAGKCRCGCSYTPINGVCTRLADVQSTAKPAQSATGLFGLLNGFLGG